MLLMYLAVDGGPERRLFEILYLRCRKQMLYVAGDGIDTVYVRIPPLCQAVPVRGSASRSPTWGRP